MIAAVVTRQLVFDGLVNGLVIGLLAVGLVLVYRSSRVINFAVGNLGAVGAALVALVVINYGFPYWIAVVAALLAGIVLGAVVELTVVRRLFSAARVTVLVATIGVAQAMSAIVAALPKVKNFTAAQYPQAVVGPFQQFGVRISGAQLTIVVAVPVVAATLSWFLNRTVFGKAVTASGDNARLARTVGINPKLVSTFVWALAGLVSTLAMVLASAQSGRVTGIDQLGPNTMVRALAATMVAGMVSFRGALAAGVAIGIGQAIVRFNFLEQTGLVDFGIFLVVLAAVWIRGRREPPEAVSLALRSAFRPIPERLRAVAWVRRLNGSALAMLGAGAVLLPIVVTTPSRILLYSTIVAYAVCSLSVTVLTGWAGQLSLGQMAFAGLAALTAAAFVRGPLPFVATLVVVPLITAAAAAIVSVGALRVNGLLLSIVTFSLGIAAAQYLYRRDVFSDGNQSSVPLPRGSLFGLDLSDQRTYYYVTLAVLAVVIVVVARLRASGVGRATIAVRDNVAAASAQAVRPLPNRLRAFALAGWIAGLGGILLAGAVQTVPLTDRFFQVEHSLNLVSMAVIGGLGTLVGAILGALWVIGLPAFFPDNKVLPFVASGIGMLVLLLYVPGGLATPVHYVRDLLLRRAERQVEPARARTAVADAVVPAPSTDSAAGGPVLAATDIVVRFGGKVAVDGASLSVAAGEIVGLIGTNGAGKSTLLNAIGGYVEAAGRVELGGVDVSSRPPAARAALGIGRTFQAARLFPELTVRETVLVALEAHHPASTLGTALALPPTRRAERSKQSEAVELIDLLGLGRYADRRVEELSTGTRRIVELVTLVARRPRVICLDEPTAGVAQRETEALAPLLVELRRQLGASMIVIEHDMPFITSISDRLYVLEAGRVIATGDPDAVRRDPLVIASYLGTDERALARSGAAAR